MTDREKFVNTFSYLHASAETLTEVMKMTTEKRKTRKLSKTLALAAAVTALVLALGVGAYAGVKWSGFEVTDGMSRAGVEQILYDASHGSGGSIVTEPDGTTHLYDAQGNETMALSWEEWKQYNQERVKTREQAVRESTDLVDVDTMWFVPFSVTELAVDAEGRFPDFALGNGSMVVLYPEGGRYFALEAGARATVRLTSNDDSIMEFVVFRDGAVISNEHERETEHEFSYEIAEPGDYCFGLIYASIAASNFTGGSLTLG